jgi:Xaa-Pro aminopeptidase
MENLARVQRAIKQLGLDGWLLYDFRASNPVLYHLLGLPKKAATTRRMALWIPQVGKPLLLVHGIEKGSFPTLSIERNSYITQKDWLSTLKGVVKGKIAMEVVPMGEMPSLSLVDGGTLEAVRSLGVEVVSSGELLTLASLLSQQEIESHHQACHHLHRLLEKFWKEVAHRLGKWNELEASQWLEEEISKGGMMTDWHPHVAVNAHAADPHFFPEGGKATIIQKGDLLLVDFGCKKGEQGIYGDLTRMAIIGREPTAEENKVFSLLLQAQRQGIALINDRLSKKERIEGREVDQAVRSVIEKGGFGPYFIHRTGHNITTSVHGMGTHLDSYETHDTRPLLSNSCCSLEPGIYLPGNFGIRLETNLLFHPTHVEVSGGWQENFVFIP